MINTFCGDVHVCTLYSDIYHLVLVLSLSCPAVSCAGHEWKEMWKRSYWKLYQITAVWGCCAYVWASILFEMKYGVDKDT